MTASIVTIIIKMLGFFIDSSVKNKSMKKESAEKYLKDLNNIVKQLTTSAVLRDSGISQSTELDAYEQEHKN